MSTNGEVMRSMCQEQLNRIFNKRAELHQIEEAFLAKNDWHHTSNTPDNSWMYKKVWKDQVILVSRDKALHLQEYGYFG
jgi:hypothetical protein